LAWLCWLKCRGGGRSLLQRRAARSIPSPARRRTPRRSLK
jgi:hypothetical protein